MRSVGLNKNSFIIIFAMIMVLSCGMNTGKSNGQSEDMDEDFVDTVMVADGHTFCHVGDVNIWDGWFLDSIYVGDDLMLTYDSIGPSKLKLGLVTRELTVDIKSSDAAHRVKRFMEPIEGFKRFRKDYRLCVDSVIDEEHGEMKCMGYITFSSDFMASDDKRANLINRTICDLICDSGSDVDVTPLTAMYIGYNPTGRSTKTFNGTTKDMAALSDFMKDRVLSEWREGDDVSYIGSFGLDLAVRTHICNPKFTTFSKYKYDRAGIGHGMYTETFHTLDLENGKMLTNEDLFKPNSMRNVMDLLFDVISKDSHYREWNGGVETGADVAERIKHWRSADPLLDGTEFDERGKERGFMLPDGALTDSGVIFSFQPYEIDCWAAGAYHFIVPYEKLIKYMGTDAKRLINP